MSANENEKKVSFIHFTPQEIEEVRSIADFYLKCSRFDDATILYAVLIFAGEDNRQIYMYLARASLGRQQFERAYMMAKKSYALTDEHDLQSKKAVAVIACKSLWSLGRHDEARDVLTAWV